MTPRKTNLKSKKSLLTKQVLTVEMKISPLPKLQLPRLKKATWGRNNKWTLHATFLLNCPEAKKNDVRPGFSEGLAYVSAINQTDLDRIKQQAPANIFIIYDPPNFQIQVAKGQLEKPIATATPKFDIEDHTFAKHFVVMENLKRPIIGLHFMGHNCVAIDTTHDLIHFPHLTMQLKSIASEIGTKTLAVLIDDTITKPPMTTKSITTFVGRPSEWSTTGTMTPVGKFIEAAILLISQSISTIFVKKLVVRVTNTTESPYSNKKNTQITEFSVVSLRKNPNSSSCWTQQSSVWFGSVIPI